MDEKKLKRLKEKRSKVLETIRMKGRELGVLNTTPRSVPSYSAVRVENLQRDISSLKEKERELLQEIEELKALG